MVIPANIIFGAELADKKSFCLVGCVVSPGFEFDDFEVVSFENLINSYPQYSEIKL
ncbi:MAG: hypothetical protein DRO88_03670 [Promethearchaeia archaeon]|nr:MAG: hypothetical protein DRO88_03670 [Candidatus Lokiarchaeia archaeon]